MTNRTKAILWVVGVFLAGTLFGGGVAALVRKPSPPPSQQSLLADPTDEEPPPETSQPGEEPQAQGPLDSPRDQKGRDRDHRGGPRRDGRRGPGMGAEVRLLARFLELDAEQRQELTGILRRGQQRWKDMDREMRQRRSQIRRDMRLSIRSILTPEQKEKFDDYIRNRRQRLREMQDRFKERLDQHPPPRDR